MNRYKRMTLQELQREYNRREVAIMEWLAQYTPITDDACRAFYARIEPWGA